MTDIEKNALEISSKISDTDVYRSFVESRQKVEDSEEATDLMNKQKELQMAVQSGELNREEAVDKINGINEELRELSVMKEYESAKNDLSEMLQNINDSLSSEIQIDFADFTSDCCRD